MPIIPKHPAPAVPKDFIVTDANGNQTRMGVDDVRQLVGSIIPFTPEQIAAMDSGITAAILSALITGVANAYPKTGGNLNGDVIASGEIQGISISAAKENNDVSIDPGDATNKPKLLVSDEYRNNYAVLEFPEKSGTLATTDDVGGASSWSELQNKPFNTIGQNLAVVNGVLKVDTTDDAEGDNTKPITSAGTYVILGNIKSLMEQI